MADNQVKLVLTAEDRTQQAFSSIKASMDGMIADMDRVRGVIAAFSSGAFVAFVKGTIDSLDALNDLNKSTGISVEQLAGLRLAAKQSGSDLEGVAQSINKLSANIGKEVERFAALGVTAKDPLQAFRQLADVFSKIEDPTLRAAMASEALGKSWATAAPLLAEGSEKIAEMVAEGQVLSGVTAEAAAQADHFNDNLVKLTQGGRLVTTMVSGLLPLLNKLTDDMVEAQKGGTGLSNAWNPLLETGKAITVLFGTVAFTLKGIGIEIGGITAQIVALATGNLSGAIHIGKEMKSDAAQARVEFDRWEKSIMDVGTASASTTPVVKALTEEDKRAASAATAAAKAFVSKGDAAEKAVKQITGFANAHVEAWLRNLIELAKLSNKEFDDAIEAEEKLLKARNDAIRGVREEAEGLEFELRTMGMSNAERAKMVALLKLQAAGMDAASEDVQKLADRIYQSTAAMEEMNRQAKLWDNIGDAAGRFFSDLVMNGKSAFDRLKAMLRDFLAELIAVFAKRWVLQLAAGVTGSGSLSAAAGSVGNGTLAGSMADMVGGIGAISGVGGSLGTSLAAGWNIGTGALGGDIAAGAGSYGIAGSIGEFAGQAWTWVAANPALAIAAVAVIVAGVIARSRSGGPKEGGSYFGGFDASGAFTGNLSVPGTDNGRFFTPSGGDSVLQQAGSAIADGYFSTLRRWGGSTGGVNFGLGFDRDPRGSADSRVTGFVSTAAGTVFNSTITAGRDDGDFATAMGLQSRRMILAALQHSVLPEGISAIVHLIDAASASVEDIDAILKLADAFSTLLEALAPVDVGSVIADAGRTAYEAFTMQGDALLELADSSTLTTESLQTLTQSAGAFRQAAVQLIAQLEAVKNSIKSMFADTYEQIFLSGLTPEQQYAYWQGVATNAQTQLQTATDPAQIQQLAQTINRAIGQAWGLLTPEQQTALRGQFLTGITSAGSAFDSRIGQVQTDTAEAANAVLTQVEERMTAAANTMMDAANRQVVAADRQLAASGTPVTVNLLVNGDPIVNGG